MTLRPPDTLTNIFPDLPSPGGMAGVDPCAPLRAGWGGAEGVPAFQMRGDTEQVRPSRQGACSWGLEPVGEGTFGRTVHLAPSPTWCHCCHESTGPPWGDDMPQRAGMRADMRGRAFGDPLLEMWPKVLEAGVPAEKPAPPTPPPTWAPAPHQLDHCHPTPGHGCRSGSCTPGSHQLLWSQ